MVHPRTDHNEWKELLKAAGVRDARLHDARHTAATMLLVLGVPSRAVMDVMGWSQIAMTTRYQHITSELTVSIADQVGGHYWPDEEEDGSAAPVPAWPDVSGWASGSWVAKWIPTWPSTDRIHWP